MKRSDDDDDGDGVEASRGHRLCYSWYCSAVIKSNCFYLAACCYFFWSYLNRPGWFERGGGKSKQPAHSRTRHLFRGTRTKLDVPAGCLSVIQPHAELHASSSQEVLKVERKLTIALRVCTSGVRNFNLARTASEARFVINLSEGKSMKPYGFS